MRYQFHAARQREHLVNDPRQLDRLRQLEEEWMRSIEETNGIESTWCFSAPTEHSVDDTVPDQIVQAQRRAWRIRDGIVRSCEQLIIGSLGTHNDFFWGLILGFFLNILALLWVCISRIIITFLLLCRCLSELLRGNRSWGSGLASASTWSSSMCPGCGVHGSCEYILFSNDH